MNPPLVSERAQRRLGYRDYIFETNLFQAERFRRFEPQAVAVAEFAGVDLHLARSSGC